MLLPQDQVFWYLNKQNSRNLTEDITTDVLVIGGGMAGISAAQSFREKGLRVVLVEKNYCGAGASGKSSGFITPNSELALHDLVRIYGAEAAQELWGCVMSGVHLIKKNIEQYSIDCDYQLYETLVLANTERAFKKSLVPEHAAYQAAGYRSQLHDHAQLGAIVGSDQYAGAISYGDSFGISVYRYCIGMKKVLLDAGVEIYEDTPVTKLENNRAQTPFGAITAQHIVVCADYGAGQLRDLLAQHVYHVQTFLMVSAPLSDEQVHRIFPDKRYMTWDTDLVYHYFRLTGDNRLLLGGASLLYTYASQETHNSAYMAQLLERYWTKKFPTVPLVFPYMWPGLIGISKDILPVAGYDQNMPSVYYVAAAAGLPWAAALGARSAEVVLNGPTQLDAFFSPYRATTLGPITQTLLGTKLTFAVSNFLSTGSI